MIPIGDNLPRQKRSLVTLMLIGLHLFLFVWEFQLATQGELSSWLQTWGGVPARIIAMSLDIWAGAWLALPFVVGSLFGSFLLHSSVAQLIGNLLFLWVFGPQVEQRLGSIRFLGFYLLMGVLTSGLSIWVAPDLAVPLLGAQGAIAAVLGAYWVNWPQAKIDSILPLGVVFIPIELPASFYIFWWFVQQIFWEIGSLVADRASLLNLGYWTHAVGFLLGIAWVKCWPMRQPTNPSTQHVN